MEHTTEMPKNIEKLNPFSCNTEKDKVMHDILTLIGNLKSDVELFTEGDCGYNCAIEDALKAVTKYFNEQFPE